MFLNYYKHFDIFKRIFNKMNVFESFKSFQGSINIFVFWWFVRFVSPFSVLIDLKWAKLTALQRNLLSRREMAAKQPGSRRLHMRSSAPKTEWTIGFRGNEERIPEKEYGPWGLRCRAKQKRQLCVSKEVEVWDRLRHTELHIERSETSQTRTSTKLCLV